MVDLAAGTGKFTTRLIVALPPNEQQRIATQVRSRIAATFELAGKSTITFPYQTIALHCTRLP